MSTKQDIVKQVGVYSLATILTQVITVGTALLTRHFLGPLQMGVWSILQIVLNYAKYTSLGMTSASSREIPFYNGKNDTEKADEVKNLVFSFTLLTAVIVSVGICVYAFLRRGFLREEVFYGLLFLAVLIILQRLNNLYIALLRAYQKFNLASSQMILSSIINAILVAACTYYFKIYGFMAAMCLSLVFNIVYISIFHKFNFSWDLTVSKIKPLAAYGFPLMILGVVQVIILSMDRIMIAKMIGLEAVGFYSIAVMMFNYIAQVPTSVGIVLMPSMNEVYGARENQKDLTVYLLRSTSGLSIILPVMIGFGWFVIPPVIHLVLPKYVEGIQAMRFLMLGAFFLALSDPYEQFIVTIKKHLYLLAFSVLVCLLAIFLNFVALAWGYAIAGVAIATASSIFFRFVIAFGLASRYLFSTGQAFKQFSLIFLKFAYMGLCLVVSDRLFDHPIFQIGFFILCYMPGLFKLNREFDILSLIKEKFLRKRYA